MKKGISVIICCYNSSKRLPVTLEYLNKQIVPKVLKWEIIVVNNASTDNTKETAISIWKQFNSPTGFRVIDQPIPGLSNARNLGIYNAQFEYCIFCDDDNWLYENYVSRAYEIMEDNSFIGALGGKGEPFFEGIQPQWFEKFKGLYAVDEQSPIEGDITLIKGHLYGAGLVIRKSAFLRSQSRNFRNVLKDRTGNLLISGGDTELCFALVLSGYKIFYEPNLKFKHYIPSNRLTESYLTKLFISISVSWIFLQPYLYVINHKEYSKLTWYKDVLYVLGSFCKPIKGIMVAVSKNKEQLMFSKLQLKALGKTFLTLLFNKKLYEKTFYELSK